MLVSGDDHWTDAKSAWIAAICAGVVTAITCAIVPFLKRHVAKQFDRYTPLPQAT